MRAEVKAALIELQDADGNIRPEDVVDVARSSNHILHAFFDWDDKSAADKQRIDRARQLIREVRIEYKRSEREVVSVRAYVHDPAAGADPVYRSVVYVADDRERVRQSLLADLRRIAGYLANVVDLANYWQVDLQGIPLAANHVGDFILALEEAPPTLFRPGGAVRKRKPKKIVKKPKAPKEPK